MSPRQHRRSRSRNGVRQSVSTVELVDICAALDSDLAGARNVPTAIETPSYGRTSIFTTAALALRLDNYSSASASPHETSLPSLPDSLKSPSASMRIA